MNDSGYRSHEGCQYQLAIVDVQLRHAVTPDFICPECAPKYGSERVKDELQARALKQL